MRALTVSAGILRLPVTLMSEMTSVCAQLADSANSRNANTMPRSPFPWRYASAKAVRMKKMEV
jgi:hypothetical protein